MNNQIQINLSSILALFARNVEAKLPKIRVMAGDKSVTVARAGERQRLPGTITLVQGPYFLGRIHLDGRFEPSRVLASRPETGAALVNALQDLASNPESVARSYGHATGCCCFCAKPLEDQRSTEVGYGPICAGKYNLPWGMRNVA